MEVNFISREQRTFVHFLRTSILSIKDLRGSGTEGINAAISTDDTVDMNEIVHKEDGLQQLLLEFFESRVNKQRRKCKFNIILKKYYHEYW